MGKYAHLFGKYNYLFKYIYYFELSYTYLYFHVRYFSFGMLISQLFQTDFLPAYKKVNSIYSLLKNLFISIL